MDERGDETGHSGEIGLTELVEAAGVSVRTVRYYIAEGLLPPPLSAGPRAAYTAEHLDRLRLIARLKDAYLPLREIRRRLRGLDAGAVRTLLNEDSAGAPPRIAETPARLHQPAQPARLNAQPGEDSAAAYLSRLLPPRPGMPPTSAPAPPAPPARSSRIAHVAQHRSRSALVREEARSPEQASERPEPGPAAPADPSDPASLIRADLDRGASLAALAALDTLTEPDALHAESWRRLRLGNDAELLIRSDAYERQREQIDALIAWARRILG